MVIKPNVIVTWPLQPKRVITKEDIVDALGINLQEWDISKIRANKWDTSMKSKTDDVIISENYQIELHLIPKLEYELKTAIQVLNETLQHKPATSPLIHNTNGTKLGMVTMYDTHIDKLDVNWTPIKKKVIKVRDAIRRTLDKLDKYGVNKLLKVNGGDYFNSDGSHKTTKWTPQENSTWEYDAWKYGFELEIAIHDMMKELWTVDSIFVPGNHDWHKLQYLRDMVAVYYKNDDNVNVIQTQGDRVYYPFWENLLWFTHGAGAKQKDLPMLAIQETKTKHKNIEIFLWHRHRQIKEDYSWAIVEVLSQASWKNAWADINGYDNHTPSVNWFVFDKKNWREAQFTEKL